MKIKKGAEVTLTYKVSAFSPLQKSSKKIIYDGRKKPYTFFAGSSMDAVYLFPAFQKALEEKESGDPFSILLQPADAVGKHHPEKIFRVSRGILKKYYKVNDLIPGDTIEDICFTDKDLKDPVTGIQGDLAALSSFAGELPEGVVSEIQDDFILIDTNLRYAGLCFEYSGKILEVKESPWKTTSGTNAEFIDFLQKVNKYKEEVLDPSSEKYQLDWGLGIYEGRVDREKRILHFLAIDDDSGEYELEVLEADVQLIGSKDLYGPGHNLFKWAWGEDHINTNTGKDIEIVKTFGEQNGFANLTQQEWVVSDYDEVFDLVHTAAFLAGAKAVCHYSAFELDQEGEEETNPDYYFALYEFRIINQEAMVKILKDSGTEAS
ncbi:MAG: hypothetical protein NTW10_10100 [Bacteroidetes bacterium]|nr:hypothetical protein [Bacteroidota bacterium]